MDGLIKTTLLALVAGAAGAFIPTANAGDACCNPRPQFDTGVGYFDHYSACPYPGCRYSTGLACPFGNDEGDRGLGYIATPTRPSALSELAAQILVQVAAGADANDALHAAAELVRLTSGTANGGESDPAVRGQIREAYESLRQQIGGGASPVLDDALLAFGREIRVSEQYSRPQTFDQESLEQGQPGPPPSTDPLLIDPSLPQDGIPQSDPGANSRPLELPPEMRGIADLGPDDQIAAIIQGTCPVGGEVLGDAGKPLKVNVAGKPVFVCSGGCLRELQSRAATYEPEQR